MISQGGGRVEGTRKAGREHPSVFSNSQGLTPTCTYMQDAVLGSDPCSSLRPGPPLLPRGSLTRADVLGPELVSPWQNVLPDSRELQSQCSSSRLRSTTDPLPPLPPPPPRTHTYMNSSRRYTGTLTHTWTHIGIYTHRPRPVETCMDSGPSAHCQMRRSAGSTCVRTHMCPDACT